MLIKKTMYRNKLKKYWTLLTNNFFLKRLQFGTIKTAGKNNTGVITIRRRGSGEKTLFRIVDFCHYVVDVKAWILGFEYAPTRTSIISPKCYLNGIIAYSIGVLGMRVANIVINFQTMRINKSTLTQGCTAPVRRFKSGVFLSVLQAKLNRVAQYTRAGGTSLKLVSVTQSHVVVKLRSKYLLKINSWCVAMLGQTINTSRKEINSLKRAGVNRRLGLRPWVRGVAKNPVDHPHGGGEGKTSGGQTSVTPWAKITKGRRTRRKIPYGNIILKR